MLIKICGIRDEETAAFAAKEGADFIGMILTPGYRRSVPLEEAKKIADAARENGATPVGVFVSEPASKIASACEFLAIEVVQAYELSEPLPQQLKRIFINEPNAELRPDRDFLLMETERPGTGAKLDFESFIPPQIQPWLIAGGLTPENVKTAILRYRPHGVDVSSGVEKEGIKSRELIVKFIDEVRNYE